MEQESLLQQPKILNVKSYFLKKAWIFVFLAALLTNSFIRPTYYALGYFLVWTLLLCTFVVSFGLFRRLLIHVYVFLIVYSALIFFTLVAYQIPVIEQSWNSWANFTGDTNSKIGFESLRDVGFMYFVHTSLPFFLILIISVQLKYFHRDWLQLFENSRNISVLPTTETIDQSAFEFTFEQVHSYLRQFYETCWRLAEMYIDRLVLICVVVMATLQFCAFNFIALLIVIVGMGFPKSKRVVSLAICIYLSSIFVVQFFVDFIHPHLTFNNTQCNISDINELKANETLIDWIGLTRRYWSECIFEMVILLLIGTQFGIYYRQHYKRALRGTIEPPMGILFMDAIDSKLLDRNFLSAFKVGCNYFFYKFGLELSMIGMVWVASIRMDSLAVVLVSSVLLIHSFSRSVVRVMWPLLVCYLTIQLVLQYALELGLPYSFCMEYPWSGLNFGRALSNVEMANLFTFFKLDTYETPRTQPDFRLIFDFTLLMMVMAQWTVFRSEGQQHPAGANDSIYRDGQFTLNKDNPHYDYIAKQRSFVDYVKIFVFMYGHWLTLVTILIAGLGRQSLFSLGYLIFGFWMLWQGNNLYTMVNHKATLRKWNILCVYTILVILCKVSMQLVGCVFINNSNVSDEWFCPLQQLFSIVCAHPASYVSVIDKHHCGVDHTEAKIGLDLLAFVFIIFQLRVLNSYFFQRCIVEIRCDVVQASRGAILINQLVEKQMFEQKQMQRRKFKSIKARMENIRKNYEEQQSKADIGCYVSETYCQAKLSGDYYMFDYDPNREDPVDDDEPSADHHLDPLQLIHTATARDLNFGDTLDAVESAEQISDEERRMIEAVTFPRLNDMASESTTQQSERPKESVGKKLFNAVRFVWKFFASGLNYVAEFFNGNSREQRYVAYVLDKEKVQLKAAMEDNLSEIDQNDWKSLGMKSVVSLDEIARIEDEVHHRWQNHAVFTKFVIAFASLLASYTHFLCYFMACLAHAFCGGLITLPLPLMVFFWATLSNPRPTRRFWLAMITYTELIILVKFVFQFGFYPWNNEKASHRVAFTSAYGDVPTILGIQKMKNFDLWEMLLLISLFLHRYMLSRIGLWQNKFNDRPTHSTPATSSRDLEIDSTHKSFSRDSLDEPLLEQTVVARKGFSQFYFKLLHPKIYYVRDLYPLMFILDVICLLLLTFFYSWFGETSSSKSFLTDTKVPIMFVVLTFFFVWLIIVDRALYLRKSVKGKLFYQLFTVILLHLWMLGALPLITNTKAVDNTAAQWFYIIKCLYLIVSAWQIRNGYPRLCVGNILTSSYGMVRSQLFQAYMALPLVFEIRTIVDWTWTETTMPLFDFIKMEVFYSKIFMVKCTRESEKKYPSPRGTPLGFLNKYIMGLPILLGVILIVLSPLLMYSLLNHIGEQTETQRIDLTVSLEGYPPFYTMSAQASDVRRANMGDWDRMRSMFGKSTKKYVLPQSRMAVSFINDYFTSDKADCMIARFRPESSTFWPISSESLLAMKKSLGSGRAHAMRFSLKFVRIRENQRVEPVAQTIDWEKKLDSNSTKQIIQSIENPGELLVVPQALPYYMVVPNDGRIRNAEVLNDVIKEHEVNASQSCAGYSNASFGLEVNKDNQLLWTIQLRASTSTAEYTLDSELIDYGLNREFKYIPMVLFVERKFPAFISSITNGGILSMYLAFVLLAARLLRNVILCNPLDVLFTELPNANNVLKLCLDIYLVREARDFILEQDLFAKLLFLFRSPETMIKWSRPKVD